nr:type I restriction endonuclease [Methanobacterium petrolearium]
MNDLSSIIKEQVKHIETEEATKTALILPFLQALGYNIFDPTEVIPEFISDVGAKQREKVDYALMVDGKPMILIECKSHDVDIDKIGVDQLVRYFILTEARFGVLTNGIIYKFYTDSEKANVMDPKPFLEVDMRKLTDATTKELEKFSKNSFNVDKILNRVNELKYNLEIKKIFENDLEYPSDDFIRYFARQVYGGVITANIKKQFSPIVKNALNQYINDHTNELLKTTLDRHSDESKGLVPEKEEKESRIITTEEEIEGFYIVRAILSEIIDIDRVAMRDKISYCGILLDDNNRKPICRFNFKEYNKIVTILDDDRNEERIAINSVGELYGISDKLKARVFSMERKK